MAIAALIQATACKLWKLHSVRTWTSGSILARCLMENKFRAVRYGLDGKLIDFGKQCRGSDERLLIGRVSRSLSD